MSTIAKLSVTEYERIVATGVFDGMNARRIELIWGELREMNPIGTEHATAVDWLNKWSVLSVGDDACVRIQNPLAFLPADSEPQPDLVWAKPRKYGKRHPWAEDVFLLVEVADSSLDQDREEKAKLYATAGVLDYWIVNLVDRTVEVHRDSKSGRYRRMQSFAAGAVVQSLALPKIGLSVDSLFAALD
ncbi:MAG TPA: Uma2 family endonuclease [Pirellulales bacterium]|jgi:Uma2 family endonuclease|nr:Uma2 family endonuclease [Pirellulales bacterium]